MGKAYTILREVYGDKRFSYISHRNNDYNVNPADYLNCGFYDQVKGMAVICNSDQSRSTALLEQAFFKGRYEIFNTLEEALQWVRTLE